MPEKPIREMTPEEIRAWNRSWERRHRLKVLFAWLVVFAIVWGAWRALKAWDARTDAQMRAQHQRELDELKKAEQQDQNSGGSSSGVCGPADGINCNSNPDLSAPQGVDTQSAAPAASAPAAAAGP